MKELTIEQKAQRYDEVLNKAKNTIEVNQTVPDIVECVESLFPELKESEGDKIRTKLLNLLKELLELGGVALDTWSMNDCEQFIAWLEKQGNNINCIYDKELSKLLHVVICRYINDPDIPYSDREKVSMKLLPYVELLEKQGEQEHLSHSCQDITELGRCAVGHEQKPDGWSENKKLYTIDVYYPTCGSEVKEAIEQGIAYSKTEKKEILISLNDIFLRITPSSTTENVLNEYNNCTGNNTVIKEKTNLINQWNNDDELYLKGVITDIECEVLCANCSREIADLKINWLKSLKNRYTWKPSDEQMDMLSKVCSTLHLTSGENEIMESIYDALKKLKDEK